MSGYKSKTIKAILNKKIGKWIESVEDEGLRKLLKRDVIVTGGAIASMLQGEEVNDFDIYLKTYETTLKVAQYYTGKFVERNGSGNHKLFVDPDFVYAKRYEAKPTEFDFTTDVNTTTGVKKRVKLVVKSVGILKEEEKSEEDGNKLGEYISQVLDNPADIEDTVDDVTIDLTKSKENEDKFRPVFLSSNAITLSDKIQIVLRFYGEPDEIHENYDFVHCTSYWTSHDDKLVLRQEALESLMSKELRYIGSKYPVCSLIRLRKFIAREWRINAGQILKMCVQISQLDLTSAGVLEDQLTGVDTAYFTMLISALKKADTETVDAAYVVEIIDRMF